MKEFKGFYYYEEKSGRAFRICYGLMAIATVLSMIAIGLTIAGLL